MGTPSSDRRSLCGYEGLLCHCERMRSNPDCLITCFDFRSWEDGILPALALPPASRFSGPCILIYWPLTGPGMSSILAATPLLDIHVSHSGRVCINFSGPRGAVQPATLDL